MSPVRDSFALSGSTPERSLARCADALAAESVGTHPHRTRSRSGLVLWAAAPSHSRLDGDAGFRGGPADVDRGVGHSPSSRRAYLLALDWSRVRRQWTAPGIIRRRSHRRLERRAVGTLFARSRTIPHHGGHFRATAFASGGRRRRRLARLGVLEARADRSAR